MQTIEDLERREKAAREQKESAMQANLTQSATWWSRELMKLGGLLRLKKEGCSSSKDY